MSASKRIRTANHTVQFAELVQRASVLSNQQQTAAVGNVITQNETSTNITSTDDKPLILSNDSNSATIEIEDNGEVKFNSGVTYKVVNDTTTVGEYKLTDNDFFISFSNSDTELITLPPAASNPGQYYIINRNFALITTPHPRAESIPFYTALKIRTDPLTSDTLDTPEQTETNVAPYSRQKIISDGIGRWHLV